METLRSALRGGVFDYILKPLVFERLEETVNRYRDHLRHLSGLVRIALDRIREVLTTGQQWSAEELGNAIGASRTTARRYLEFLVGKAN